MCLVLLISVGEDVAMLGSTRNCSISVDSSQWGYTGERPLLFTRRRVEPLEEEEFPVCLVLLVSVGEDVTTLGNTGDCSISVDISQYGAVQVIQVIIFPGHLAHLVSVGGAIAEDVTTLGSTRDCSISTDISQYGAVQVIQVIIFPGHLAHLVSVGGAIAEDVTTLGSTRDCSISTDISQYGAVQVIQVIIFPGHLAHLVSVGGAIAEDVTTLGSTRDCSISTDISQWGYTGDRSLFIQTQSRAFGGGGGGVPSMSGSPRFCWRRCCYAGEYKELQYLSGHFTMGLYR